MNIEPLPSSDAPPAAHEILVQHAATEFARSGSTLYSYVRSGRVRARRWSGAGNLLLLDRRDLDKIFGSRPVIANGER